MNKLINKIIMIITACVTLFTVTACGGLVQGGSGTVSDAAEKPLKLTEDFGVGWYTYFGISNNCELYETLLPQTYAASGTLSLPSGTASGYAVSGNTIIYPTNIFDKGKIIAEYQELKWVDTPYGGYQVRSYHASNTKAYGGLVRVRNNVGQDTGKLEYETTIYYTHELVNAVVYTGAIMCGREDGQMYLEQPNIGIQLPQTYMCQNGVAEEKTERIVNGEKERVECYFSYKIDYVYTDYLQDVYVIEMDGDGNVLLRARYTPIDDEAYRVVNDNCDYVVVEKTFKKYNFNSKTYDSTYKQRSIISKDDSSFYALPYAKGDGFVSVSRFKAQFKTQAVSGTISGTVSGFTSGALSGTASGAN